MIPKKRDSARDDAFVQFHSRSHKYDLRLLLWNSHDPIVDLDRQQIYAPISSAVISPSRF